MEGYTRKMAGIFHAFRIDNCHSTPIHLAEHLLKVARQVRPDLYVCAELFTGSEEKDFAFVTRLGINSLIREAMAAWDSNEMRRIISNYGGQPRGSLAPRIEYGGPNANYSSRLHALFMDCTHDNETPNEKRTAVDALSTAALVAFSVTASGSTRGFDELVPKHLNIVHEHRRYAATTGKEGIIPGKECS